MTLSLAQAKAQIDQTLNAYASSGAPATSLVPSNLTKGKVYEAWVLCEVLAHLRYDEGFAVTLRQGSSVCLKSSPGPINRRFPYFEIRGPFWSGEVWTDVEFLALSYAQRAGGSTPLPSDYHELDIVVVPPGTVGRPAHHEVRLGVECKNTSYSKGYLREILGVRRELSLLQNPQPTSFTTWPRHLVPAEPPSCLVVCSTDRSATDHQLVGEVFGIDFTHLPLP